MKKTQEQIRADKDTVMIALKKYGNNIMEIAKQTGFSRQKVWRNIKRLEEENIICGYTTVLNERKAGRRKFILLVKRKCVPFAKGVNVFGGISLEREAQLSRVTIDDIILTNGYYDVVFVISANSIVAVNSFNESLCHLFKDEVDDIITLDGLYTLKQSGQEVTPLEEVKHFYSLD